MLGYILDGIFHKLIWSPWMGGVETNTHMSENAEATLHGILFYRKNIQGWEKAFVDFC
jgi:hypothetical protein